MEAKNASQARACAAASLAELIGPIEDRLLATVWRVLRHPQDAEDALNTAMTTVWEELPRIGRHPNPQALSLKSCADAAVDHFRRRQRNRERQDVSELTDSVAAPTSDPPDEVIARESLDEIMLAVARLSQHQATAVV